jgi:hypothetical protein
MNEIFAAQIKTMELQLAMLKARIERARAADARPTAKCLGDLFGILAGTGTSSEEDIDRALYTLEEEGPSVKRNAK